MPNPLFLVAEFPYLDGWSGWAKISKHTEPAVRGWKAYRMVLVKADEGHAEVRQGLCLLPQELLLLQAPGLGVRRGLPWPWRLSLGAVQAEVAVVWPPVPLQVGGLAVNPLVVRPRQLPLVAPPLLFSRQP